MIKKTKLFLIIASILIFTGCTVLEGEISDRIVSPANINIPISGKWEASHIYDDGFIPISDEKTLEERGIEAHELEAFFHNEGVALGERFTENPAFRIKNVLSYDYLSRNFRITPDDIGLEGERVEIITVLNNVLDDNILLFDLVKLDSKTILVKVDDLFYIFERVMDELSHNEVNRYIDIQKEVLDTLGIPDDEDHKSALLLGLKIPSYDELSSNIDWEYRTVLINSEDGTIRSLYQTDKLLLPRKNGFWEIEKERTYTRDIVRDHIVARPLFRDDEKQTSNRSGPLKDMNEVLETEIDYGSELKNILFVGNDYLSVENINLDNNDKQTLEIYSVDQVRDEVAIKLSDLIGQDGRDLFIEGARNEMSLDSNIGVSEENIGLFRRKGHWSLNGRVNYVQSGEELYRDFNIRAIPPQEMVSFDEQITPYNIVNLAVPGLLDYFSSPNGDIIVALTSNHLSIYPVEKGELIRTPISRFRIPSASTVIMSEWARGRYTEIWEDEIIDNGGVEIEE